MTLLFKTVIMEIDFKKYKSSLKPWSSFNEKKILKQINRKSYERFIKIVRLIESSPCFQDLHQGFGKIYRLHRLQGNRKNTWAMDINSTLRFCFTVVNLEEDLSNSKDCHHIIVTYIEDYH